jgi:hypothetical protein
MRRLHEEALTSDRVGAKQRMDSKLGKDWQMLVIELPGAPEAKEPGPDFLAKAKRELSAAGRSPEIMPEDPEGEGHGMSEASGRGAELCRRIRQLAADLEDYMGAEADGAAEEAEPSEAEDV